MRATAGVMERAQQLAVVEGIDARCCVPCTKIKRQDRDQHQQSAALGEEEELDRRVDRGSRGPRWRSGSTSAPASAPRRRRTGTDPAPGTRPMTPARVHSRLKWKKPTCSRISVQEESTAMMPRKQVSRTSRRLKPVACRGEARMPKLGNPGPDGLQPARGLCGQLPGAQLQSISTSSESSASAASATHRGALPSS